MIKDNNTRKKKRTREKKINHKEKEMYDKQTKNCI